MDGSALKNTKGENSLLDYLVKKIGAAVYGLHVSFGVN